MDCTPDFRQKIATSWPRCLDDSNVGRYWGWDPEFDIDGMSTDILQALQNNLNQEPVATSGK